MRRRRPERPEIGPAGKCGELTGPSHLIGGRGAGRRRDRRGARTGDGGLLEAGDLREAVAEARVADGSSGQVAGRDLPPMSGALANEVERR